MKSRSLLFSLAPSSPLARRIRLCPRPCMTTRWRLATCGRLAVWPCEHGVESPWISGWLTYRRRRRRHGIFRDRMPNQRRTWVQSTWSWGAPQPFCPIFPTQQARDALLNRACLTKQSTIWVWLKIGHKIWCLWLPFDDHVPWCPHFQTDPYGVSTILRQPPYSTRSDFADKSMKIQDIIQRS